MPRERTMSIELSKPFGSYVAEEKLVGIADAQVFLFRLPFEIEGTNKTEEMRHGPWKYSGTQQAIDEMSGVDGLKLRRILEMAAFCRYVEAELTRQGQHLYEKQGQRILIRGPIRPSTS
jgi:hypothetical protein